MKHDTPVIGVNRGRLGFLTDVSPDELIDQVSAVLDGDFISEKRFLLDTEVWRGEQVIGRGDALNDIVVNSGASAQMIEFELSIDGEFVYRLTQTVFWSRPPQDPLRIAYPLAGRSCIPVWMHWFWFRCSRIH